MKRNWMLIVAIALMAVSLIGLAGAAVTAAVLRASGTGGGTTACPWCGSLFDEWGRRDDDRNFGGGAPRSQETTPPTETTPSPTPSPRGPGGGTPASDGENIFLYGATQQRHIPFTGGPVWFTRMGGGCANCHGSDGAGGSISMMGQTLKSPDIRYSVLTSGAAPGGTPWTDQDIRAAVTKGVEPDGKQMDRQMPRWEMTTPEFDALLTFMKEMNKA